MGVFGSSCFAKETHLGISKRFDCTIFILLVCPYVEMGIGIGMESFKGQRASGADIKSPWMPTQDVPGHVYCMIKDKKKGLARGTTDRQKI